MVWYYTEQDLQAIAALMDNKLPVIKTDIQEMKT